MGTRGTTSSTRCAAVSAALCPVHELHTVRPLHEKPIRSSLWHVEQPTRTKPSVRSPQRKKALSSLTTKAGSPPNPAASSRNSLIPSRTAR